MIDIRFCRTDEIKKLQHFIHTYWKADHILSKSEELLRFQHYNVKKDRFNFVVADDTTTDAFVAILGFIPTSQYDPQISKTHLWLAIWKKDDNNAKTKGLGMKLYNYLMSKYTVHSVAAIGINDKIKELYQKLGFRTGTLHQEYFIKRATRITYIPNSEYCLTRKLGVDDLSDINIEPAPSIPVKSLKYFVNRYVKHPMYTYQFYSINKAVDDKFELVDVMVVRKMIVNIKGIKSCCLRIVDAFNGFRNVGDIRHSLNQLLLIEDAEYIDCLFANMDIFVLNGTPLHKMGFTERVGDEIILPNYFEPFEHRNVNIEFAYKIQDGSLEYNIFKGDSDQDRPNLLP